MDVIWNCSVFLNVIINLNKEQQRLLISLEESENEALSLQSLCVWRERERIQIYSIACIIPLCICESEGKRERERGGQRKKRESPYVHWRQPEASVYLKAFRAEMIRGCEPNTFIRALHGDRSWGVLQRRIKILRTEKKWNNLFQEWSGGDLEMSMCGRGRAEEWIKDASSVCVR